MLPLSQVIHRHKISFHCYADDTQIYLPLKTDDPSGLDLLKDCLRDIKEWMSQSFLQLNDTKSEILLFGNSTSVSQIRKNLGSLATLEKPHVKNLGVIFDPDLKFDKQVKSVVKSCFFQLRTIAKIKSFLSPSDLRRVVLMLIFSRLDYCNALYAGVTNKTIHSMQLVQNAAARLVTGAKMREHISPILSSLHWLPVKRRVKFKIVMFVFKALNGLAPAYIKDLLDQPTSSRLGRCLRSDNQMTLKVPRSNLVTRGDRAFSVMAPRLWNKLPLSIKSATTLDSFRARLKTHLFTADDF
ncbi:uncharacterized protein LOC133649723 [Entelurus aequoreus]|uniref:uncharacterized protein LOC133649723 n=1 Tax=Entelurus aequoreus TaxID=161455 RepID=UPI002B1E6311|nr:uncharacterized protein LOC133649723 [Entelurus aequoreus]